MKVKVFYKFYLIWGTAGGRALKHQLNLMNVKKEKKFEASCKVIITKKLQYLLSMLFWSSKTSFYFP